MDDLKNRLGLDAQSQKVDWGTLGVLGSESIAKLKYVITLDDGITFFSFVCLISMSLFVSVCVCMCVCMYVCAVCMHVCVHACTILTFLYVCMYARCLKYIITEQVRSLSIHLHIASSMYAVSNVYYFTIWNEGRVCPSMVKERRFFLMTWNMLDCF